MTKGLRRMALIGHIIIVQKFLIFALKQVRSKHVLGQSKIPAMLLSQESKNGLCSG